MEFLIYILIALLSGLGVGGGGLFALYLKLFSSLPQLQIQAFNLFFFLAASAFALIIHLFKRKIFFLPVLVMLIFGVAGSLSGSALALVFSPSLLGKIFGLMLLATGFYSLLGRKKG